MIGSLVRNPNCWRMLPKRTKFVSPLATTTNTTMMMTTTTTTTIMNGGGDGTRVFQSNTSLWYRYFSDTKKGVGYQIEVSNAERPDATKLIVRGPDVDGIMASMTVALFAEGCSLVQLHAGKKEVDTATEHFGGDDTIEDIFFVVSQETGKPFPDDKLETLAFSLLEALQNPITVLSAKGLSRNVGRIVAAETPVIVVKKKPDATTATATTPKE